MNLRILTCLLCFAGSIAAIGHALRQRREIGITRNAMVELAEKRVALEAKISDARLAAAAVKSRPVTRPCLPASPRAMPVAEVGPHGAEAARAHADPLVNDPALQQLYLIAERASLEALYASLERRLGFTPPQSDAFKAIVMERHEQRLDLADLQASRDLDEGDQLLTALRRKAVEDFETKLVTLLGKRGYQEFKEHERALPVLRLVNRFAGAVALEGQPLSAAQAEDLTRVIANASAPYSEGGEADPNHVDWPVALENSAAVLSPPQQQSFLNMAPRYPVDSSPVQPGPI